MKRLNIAFQNEEGTFQPKRCQVEKVIKLSWEEFSMLCQNPYSDYTCINNYATLMRIGEKGEYHCILFLNTANNDGIVVMDTPDEREIAYMPYAKNYVEMEKYPSLEEFNRNMIDAVDEQIQKALESQKKGEYDFDESELYDKEPFDYDLFLAMAAERDEIDSAERYDETLRLVVSPKFVYKEDDSKLRVITQKEFELACAKHLLWMEEGVGKQADFSNCLLRDLNLSDRTLVNMIFDGAKIIDVNMNGADLSYSTFNGTRFINCACVETIATEAEFEEAKFSNCDMGDANLSNSNFRKTAFWNCKMFQTNMQGSCLEKTKFHRTDIVNSDTTDCVYDEQEWASRKHGLNMGG